MDYSFYPTAPQPAYYLGLPPTPAHTHATNSADDYSNGSPADNYENPFTNFDTFTRFDTNGLVADSSQQQQQKTSVITDAGSVMEAENDLQRGRSSSEEKESLTPAQSRRKAQNRAAQRAFRERKERHVKDLEQKLTSLEQSSSSLMADNERLKRELQKVATENEILRATGINGRGSAGETNGSVVGPMSYSPSEFYSNLLRSHDNKTPSHRITISDTTGERLLGAGATWDAIQDHSLYKSGLVDVGDVCDRLKNLAKCDGQGPVFEERDIRMAIEQSAASGSDELI
ncbi:hypothetical protein GP486_006828 [Trichoglossum hirsutum]|uniref:BZIP domain-containing protein n=1 Tax=Trichoglossum hirsutum TaxID=265104 RepID=A0A9P8L769_9PEZI|nr:hypothetical protein GP486_006828 [Trichoglossum hirsutum]